MKLHMEERIEHIRKRPGMYVGRLGNGANEQDGIYNLLKIIFYSLIRQFREGISDELTISIHDGKNVKISYPSTEIGYIEIVQALSSSFEISDEGGRAILSFTPDETIFEGFSYRQSIVSVILKSYCYANAGLTIKYNDKEIYAPNGLADLINDEFSDNLQYPVIHLSDPGIEIAFANRAKTYNAIHHSFVNGIKTEGGTHVNALKDALVKVIGNIFYDVDICPSEILEGLSAAISIDVDDPVYGQANPGILASVKLSPENPDIKEFVYTFMSKKLTQYLEQNPQVKSQLQGHFTEYAIHM